MATSEHAGDDGDACDTGGRFLWSLWPLCPGVHGLEERIRIPRYLDGDLVAFQSTPQRCANSIARAGRWRWRRWRTPFPFDRTQLPCSWMVGLRSGWRFYSLRASRPCLRLPQVGTCPPIPPGVPDAVHQEGVAACSFELSSLTSQTWQFIRAALLPQSNGGVTCWTRRVRPLREQELTTFTGRRTQDARIGRKSNLTVGVGTPPASRDRLTMRAFLLKGPAETPAGNRDCGARGQRPLNRSLFFVMYAANTQQARQTLLVGSRSPKMEADFWRGQFEPYHH